MSENIYSVSQLNSAARQMLEGNFSQIWLTGEISNFTQPVSGHWYLTLKDENAQVRGAMFRMKNLRVGFRPQNGMQVLVRANVSLYEPRGDYQLIIESMHPAGEGLLQQQFETLKMKLAAEGLFAQNLKKSLPDFAKAVGIVTSSTGAALQDILHILARRDPSLKVVIYPTAVQGKEATAEIVQMIDLANARQEVDVLIVGRGGGSIEDLWAFNEEAVVRKIALSPVPIISAVGHETDTTLSDYAADWRAGTPSIAAEMVAKDNKATLTELNSKKAQLNQSATNIFMNKKMLLHSHLKHSLLLEPERFLDSYKLNLDTKVTKLEESLANYLKKCQEAYERRVNSLVSLNPLAVLNRGYTYVKKDDMVVKSVKNLALEDSLSLCFMDGTVKARIEEIEEKKNG